MWTCNTCGAKSVDDTWLDCWKCGTLKSSEGPTPEEKTEIQAKIAKASRMNCLRCDSSLKYLGKKKLHEGTRQWGFWLGDLGELFTNREHVDFYVCPTCGKLELFSDGIGEEFRNET
jgi:Zn finger protein HypA/HybF involved in hydrogenase expression